MPRKSKKNTAAPKVLNSSHDEFFKSTFGLMLIAQKYLDNYLPAEVLSFLDTTTLTQDPIATYRGNYEKVGQM